MVPGKAARQPAAIPPRSAKARKFLFQHQNRQARLRLAQVIGRPKPSIARPDDDDISRLIPRQRGAATFVGFITLVWAASGVFDVLQHALDRAWRVPHGRALWLQRLLSLGFVGLLGFLFLVSASTALASQEFVLQVFGVSPLAHDLVRWFSALTGFVLAWIAFTILYKVIPLVTVAWSVALRGGLVAAVLWQAAKVAYEIYLNFFAQFSLVYGSVGAVIGLLLWGYISAMVLLYGGELAAALHEREKLR